MDIIQAHWRGKQLNHGKDGNGAYITMMGTQSLLYFPIVIKENSTYKITIEARNDSGNGVVCCNIYGNKHYDFPQIILNCDNTVWGTYSIDIGIGTFPKTLPFVFRLWRSPKGTGNLSIRRIVVELLEEANSEVKIELSLKSELLPNTNVIQQPEINFTSNTQLRPKLDKQLLNTYVKMLNFDSNRQKVLYLPLNSDSIQQTGMEDAFMANGFSVCSFDHRRYNLKIQASIDAALQYLVDMVKPDWIHAQLQFCNYLSPTTIANIQKDYPSTFFTIWTGDIRSKIDENFASFVPFVDYALLSNMGQISNYEDVCGNYGNVKYWQIGYDPKLFYRETDEIRNEYQQKLKHDICLCANYIPIHPGSKDRRIISEILQKKYNDRFALYGSGWHVIYAPKARCWLNFFEQQKAYNGSKIILSINNFNDVEMYFSDRQLIAMASGTATISRYIPGLERYFQNRVHTAWFTTTEECIDLVDYYLSHPEEAEKMGKAGADIVRKQHTYASRVKELCDQLDINNVKQQTKQIESQDKMTVLPFVNISPELSMVFGTYNRLSTLKITLPRMLESGAGVNLEIIINDGGSTDGTKEWLKEFSKLDNRIKPIFSDTLEGVTAAYNRGFEAARGKFVMWLSDDTAPVGTTIADLVQFMKNLDETDMAALPQGTRGFGNYTVPIINNILCATVGCLYHKTLEKMEYWNMDYPYYAQDIELSARIWRRGGRVLECKDAKIEHFVVGDWLRMHNCQKYEKDGRIEKFFLMYKGNYGQKAYYMYPAILVCDDICDIPAVAKYVNNFKKIFKNIIIHTVDSPMLTELCEICGSMEIVQKSDINNYDFLITKDGFCYRDTGKPVVDPCLAELGFVKIPVVAIPSGLQPSIVKNVLTKTITSTRFEIPNGKCSDFIKYYNDNPKGKKVLYLYLPMEGKFPQIGTDQAFLDNGFELCTFDFLSAGRKYGIPETSNYFKCVAKEFQPDWIHMQLQDANIIQKITLQEIRQLVPNVFLTNWTGDIRNGAIQYFVNVSDAVDLPIISSIGQIQMYKDAGCKNVEYWQIGYDPKLFYRESDKKRAELNAKYNHDIVFCANPTTIYPASVTRNIIVQMLSDNFGNKFAAYGLWNKPFSPGPCTFAQQQTVYNASKIVISVNNFNNVEMYFSDRQLIAMASGTLTICHYIPGLERYFDNGKDLVWFHNLDECVNLVGYYLKHPEEADPIGRSGAKRVYDEHSYYKRIKQLSERVGITNKLCVSD